MRSAAIILIRVAFRLARSAHYTLSDFREVQGVRIPFHVEVGNMFGTDEYCVFFKAKLVSVRVMAPYFERSGYWATGCLGNQM